MASGRPHIQALAAIEIDLPQEAEALYEIAHNLWWTWSPRARRLFAVIHHGSWAGYRNPVEVLLATDHAHWEQLLGDTVFINELAAVTRSYRTYMESEGDTWFQQRFPDYEAGPMAYLSMEYGLHENLAIYSGGLGVLSGDHCKSASDLGVPLVAVGLLYRRGYFRQTIDAEGYQQHIYPLSDFARLGLRPVASRTGGELTVSVPFPDREVHVKVWTVQIGRIPLLLLDTDNSANHPADRPITGVLYVRGREMRLAQEMILGVGGVRTLAALGIEPAIWHLNEGHSALLQLERLRSAGGIGDGGLDAAVDAVRAGAAFTTHTQVSAGHESFDRDVAHKYLEPWAELTGAATEHLLALGHARPADPAQPFNLTALALRSTSWVNGVSHLNAEVSQREWNYLGDEGDGPAIHAITNGIHLPTWMGREMSELLGSSLSHDGIDLLANGDGSSLEAIADEELWRAHDQQKQHLARFTCARIRRQYARHGRSPDELRDIDEFFEEEALTLGFARRFATYKRASLLFTDLERVRSLFSNPERPLRVLFAGKAHPADRPGQELIQQLFRLSQDEQLHGRLVFLENYDLHIARMLVQGVDVWLNTPRRPLEACGTSGMKAAVNGVLNCSILDGWWQEAFSGDNGWAIDGGDHDNDASQDHADALALYRTLEEEILPTFYERDEAGLPRRWLHMMKRSIATAAIGFSSDRMVKEYVERAYMPLAISPREPPESTPSGYRATAPAGDPAGGSASADGGTG